MEKRANEKIREQVRKKESKDHERKLLCTRMAISFELILRS